MARQKSEFLKDLAQLVADGKYDWVTEDIKKYWTLSPIVPVGDSEAILLHCGKDMPSEAVLADSERQGLRLGTDRELLELGAQHPDLQREFPIVELGTVVGVGGCRRVLYLYRHGGERGLYLSWFAGVWSGRCRFLAFRK